MIIVTFSGASPPQASDKDAWLPYIAVRPQAGGRGGQGARSGAYR